MFVMPICLRYIKLVTMENKGLLHKKVGKKYKTHSIKSSVFYIAIWLQNYYEYFYIMPYYIDGIVYKACNTNIS